jgi:DNA-directed RNA polymerase subunit beta
VRGANGWQIPFVAEHGAGRSRASTSSTADTGEIVFPAGTKITPRAANKAGKDGLSQLVIPTEEVFGRYSA